MQVCSSCGKQYTENRLFCDCGQRLTVTSGAGAEAEMRTALQQIASGTAGLRERIDALEQLAIVGQRIPTAEGPAGSGRRGDLRALDRGAAGFASFAEFVQVLGANPGDGRLQSLNTRALATLPGSAGGFLVPTEWSDALVAAADYASIVRPYARFAPQSAEHPDAAVELPLLDYSAGRFAGITVAWLGEGSAKPESQPVFREVTVKPNEIAGFCELTDKLIRNVPGVSTLLAGEFAKAIAAMEDDAYLSGSGVAQPRGWISHPACLQIPRTGPGAVVYADFVNMVAASRGRQKRWIISQTVIAQIAMATLPGGLTPLWQPSANGWGSVLGFPVDIWEAAPVLGTLGDVLLVDWSYYLIADGVGLRFDMTNAHGALFTQNRSVVKVYMATDGQPWISAPITLADGVTRVSPFVALL